MDRGTRDKPGCHSGSPWSRARGGADSGPVGRLRRLEQPQPRLDQSHGTPHNTGWLYVGRDRRQHSLLAAETDQHRNGQASRRRVEHEPRPGPVSARGLPARQGNTIYATTSTDVVEAIDATTGKIEWTYAPEVNFSFTTGVGGLGVSTNRGVAFPMATSSLSHSTTSCSRSARRRARSCGPPKL